MSFWFWLIRSLLKKLVGELRLCSKNLMKLRHVWLFSDWLGWMLSVLIDCYTMSSKWWELWVLWMDPWMDYSLSFKQWWACLSSWQVCPPAPLIPLSALWGQGSKSTINAPIAFITTLLGLWHCHLECTLNKCAARILKHNKITFQSTP